ncbi:DNA-dependent metalloprotease WSS1-like [Chenopodium quinoa]|uniref:DNA-dependent metalloprotease WSS1-like n=1 Tax=Chenopodium quinoa TaxID=63459 RepID=UPI000B794D01|nr:DNA-dependent metalloprotease WSS1-like [Chenopodium quinoa]
MKFSSLLKYTQNGSSSNYGNEKFTCWPCSPKINELLGLNVNRGVEVKLRLWRPGRELEFYSFHEVLDTMLHELCHNAHGPHNASFYQLWDQLIKECEESMSKGISGTGEGFDFSGKCLNGFSRQQPLASLHKRTLAAAENRKHFNSLLPSGPLRLGGDNNKMSALSPVQAASMEAERRLQDGIWCAFVSGGFADDLGDSDLLKQLYRVGQLLPVPIQMPLIVITYILELQDLASASANSNAYKDFKPRDCATDIRIKQKVDYSKHSCLKYVSLPTYDSSGLGNAGAYKSIAI